MVLACSFQDMVIVDLAVSAVPAIEVVFCDTGAHFPETLTFVETCPGPLRAQPDRHPPGARGPRTWPCGSARCCEFRKVGPLRNALAGRPAWITALKRVDSPTRAVIPIVSYDETFGLVKVNPIVTWTDDDIDAYEADHGLPAHPLVARGYRSIGCAPTTRPTAVGEDPRAGRWAESGKTECGLHGG